MKQELKLTAFVAAMLTLGLAGCQQKEEPTVPETLAPAAAPAEPAPLPEAPASEAPPSMEDKSSMEPAPDSTTPAK